MRLVVSVDDGTRRCGVKLITGGPTNSVKMTKLFQVLRSDDVQDESTDDKWHEEGKRLQGLLGLVIGAKVVTRSSASEALNGIVGTILCYDFSSRSYYVQIADAELGKFESHYIQLATRQEVSDEFDGKYNYNNGSGQVSSAANVAIATPQAG